MGKKTILFVVTLACLVIVGVLVYLSARELTNNDVSDGVTKLIEAN